MLRPGGGSGGGGGPAPVFTLPLQNLTVQVGRNATFTCYVRHIQRYQVSLLPYARWGGGLTGRERGTGSSRQSEEGELGGREKAGRGAREGFALLPSLRERNCPSSIILVHRAGDIVPPCLQEGLLFREGQRSNVIGLGLRSSPLCPSLHRIPLNYRGE